MRKFWAFIAALVAAFFLVTSCWTPTTASIGVLVPAAAAAVISGVFTIGKSIEKKHAKEKAEKKKEAEPFVPMEEHEANAATRGEAETFPEASPPPVDSYTTFIESEENEPSYEETTEPPQTELPHSDSDAIELILQKRVTEAKELITRKNVNTKDANGLTSLHAAAMINDAELVTWLLGRGADSEELNEIGETPLHTAVTYDSVDAAQALVDGDANVFALNGGNKMAFSRGIEKSKDFYYVFVIPKVGKVRDIKGQNIVHYFVRTEDIDGTALCIERALPLDMRDNNGMTPLALAYENKKSAVSAALAAALVLSGVTPIRGEFAYFENTVTARSARQLFDDAQTALHLAVIADHYGIAEYLIACGATVDAKDSAGATALHLAVRYGRTDIASLLIESGADVNACDSTLKTPLLITAPKEAQNEVYSLLLENEADASLQDIFGDNALHIATMGSMSRALITKLINYGALVNEQNKKGLTPLAQAVDQKNRDHVSLYVSYGADVFSSDSNGKTPLTRCLRDGNLLTALITESNKALTDQYGNSALHIATEQKATQGSVRYLLDLGIDVNAENCYGETPLFTALKNDNYNAVNQLIERGANVNHKDNQGNSALHTAVKWAAEKSVAKLLENGADTNAKNNAGKTPLAEAARKDRIGIMKLLKTKAGADVNAQDATGKTALMDAIECKNPVAATVLLQNGANSTLSDIYGRNALHEAAASGSAELIRIITSSGVNPLSSDLHGKTPLSSCLDKGTATIDVLLGSNTALIDVNKNTPLHIAVSENASVEVVSFLIGKKYPINAQNVEGKTALMIAISGGLNECAVLLLQNGSDIFVKDGNGENAVECALKDNPSVLTDMARISGRKKDRDGNTLLHYAAKEVSRDVFDVLVEYGADKTIRNNAGLTAEDILSGKSRN